MHLFLLVLYSQKMFNAYNLFDSHMHNRIELNWYDKITV